MSSDVSVGQVVVSVSLAVGSAVPSGSAAKLDRGIESADVAETEDAVEGHADAVVNHLGGEYTGLSQSLLRPGGTMVVCGRAAGDVSETEVADLFLRHKRIVGSPTGTQSDLEASSGSSPTTRSRR